MTGAGERRRRPTLADVGARAHVSAQTVSRVVNGAPGVAGQTRELVQRAIDELGFVPDAAARSLRTGRPVRSRRIGVLAHQLTATGPSGNTAAALAELRAAGYELDVVPLDDDAATAATAAVAAVMERFDRTTCGVLAMAQTDAVRAAVLGAGVGVPVYVDEHLDDGTPDRPGADRLTARAAADHLLGLGHRVVAHVPGPPGSLSARFRRECFRAAVEEAGARCVDWGEGDWSAASGYRVASAVDLVDGGAEVSAVFAANDAMAFGVLRAFAERGIAVPGEVAVMGADDLPESPYASPALTSVHHDTAAEGRLAARVLLADVDGGPRPDPAATLVVEVRARASTVGASAGAAPQTRDR